MQYCCINKQDVFKNYDYGQLIGKQSAAGKFAFINLVVVAYEALNNKRPWETGIRADSG